MSVQKRYRQGQILKLITSGAIGNQDELRRQLAHLKLRVTQATLSRDLRELKLVKTPEGYKQVSAAAEETAPLPGPLQALGHALREFLLDIRPAENLLVLKTPPGGAQPLAAALDAEHSAEVAGTIAGDDTVLVVTPTRKTREALQKKIEELVQ
ncbi:MAG: ArgR family transcriptional regulator [Candidatus Acidiferrales bacterium]|jgi:transcriptional regulator of arginine metabolism